MKSQRIACLRNLIRTGKFPVVFNFIPWQHWNGQHQILKPRLYHLSCSLTESFLLSDENFHISQNFIIRIIVTTFFSFSAIIIIIASKFFSFSAIIIIIAPKFRNIAILGQNFGAIMMIIALNEKIFVTIMVSISLSSN